MTEGWGSVIFGGGMILIAVVPWLLAKIEDRNDKKKQLKEKVAERSRKNEE